MRQMALKRHIRFIYLMADLHHNRLVSALDLALVYGIDKFSSPETLPEGHPARTLLELHLHYGKRLEVILSIHSKKFIRRRR